MHTHALRRGMAPFAPLAALIVAGCSGSSSSTPAAVPMGSVEIVTFTNGVTVDTDGYSVTVGGLTKAVPPNGALLFQNVPAGEIEVTFGDIDSLCTLVGDNPRMATVNDGAKTQVIVELSCIPPTGTLELSTTAFGGGARDPDGYIAFVGTQQQRVGIEETITFFDVPRGDVEVRLTDLAGNCNIPAGNPQIVTVIAGQTSQAAFDVACTSAQMWMSFDGSLEDRAARPQPHDGTFIGNAVFATDTPSGVGGSVFFDGMDDAVEIANAPDLDVSGVPYTVSAWIKTTEEVGIQPILAKSPVGPRTNVRAVSLFLDDHRCSASATWISSTSVDAGATSS